MAVLILLAGLSFVISAFVLICALCRAADMADKGFGATRKVRGERC